MYPTVLIYCKYAVGKQYLWLDDEKIPVSEHFHNNKILCFLRYATMISYGITSWLTYWCAAVIMGSKNTCNKIKAGCTQMKALSAEAIFDTSDWLR